MTAGPNHSAEERLGGGAICSYDAFSGIRRPFAAWFRKQAAAYIPARVVASCLNILSPRAVRHAGLFQSELRHKLLRRPAKGEREWIATCVLSRRRPNYR